MSPGCQGIPGGEHGRRLPRQTPGASSPLIPRCLNLRQNHDVGPCMPGLSALGARHRRAPQAAPVRGLRLDEAKDLLAAVQEKMVAGQAGAALAEKAACPSCGTTHRHKDYRDIVMRTLFGTLRLPSPRWWHCSCSPHEHRTFSPLAEVLPGRATPELLYLEAKFAGLASYGLSARLPLGRPLHATAVRLHTQAIAQRLEDELGTEQQSFIEGCQAAWEELPRPRHADRRGHRRRLRPLIRATFPPGRLVRGDRRQVRPPRREGQMLRLRADLRHQAAPRSDRRGPRCRRGLRR